MSFELESIYKLNKNGEDRLASKALMYFIEMNIKNNDFSTIDNLLQTINLNLLGVRSLIGLVRSSYRVKENLPTWNENYLNSRNRVIELGENVDSIFMGISNE